MTGYEKDFRPCEAIVRYEIPHRDDDPTEVETRRKFRNYKEADEWILDCLCNQPLATNINIYIYDL